MKGKSRTARVALYARVSTRDKDQDPELQLQPMREYAAQRECGTTEYVDHAAAGDLSGRKQWAQLLDDIHKHHVDHVIAWKLDRCFRSTLHCLRTLEDWEHRNVEFSCITQDIDTSSPTGRLLITMLAAVAEFERGLISERVREGMTNARRKGIHVGRPAALDRPHVAKHLPSVLTDLDGGHISKREACRRLKVGTATLDRILSAPKGEYQ